MLKIVYILDTLEIGGTERQFIELMRHLDRRRFAPCVLSFPCEGRLREEIERLEVPFTCLDFSGITGMFRPHSYVQLYELFRKMIRYLKQESPDIVQSYLFWANVYGSVAARMAGVPVMITGQRSSVRLDAMKRHYRWLQSLSEHLSTAVVTNSHSARQEYLQRRDFGLHQKIHVVHNGIELARYGVHADSTDMKETLHIPNDAPVIGIIANLHPCKGHQDVLKAAAYVLRTYPQAHFLFVGRDKGIQAELTALAEQLGIRKAIIFTGQRDDIPELLSIMDIVVSASYFEGVSNAILEGMASRKPVVATAVGGTPELVSHERTGLLVPPGQPALLAEAILRLWRDERWRLNLGQAGRKQIEEMFAMERMVAKIEQLYESLVPAKQ